MKLVTSFGRIFAASLFALAMVSFSLEAGTVKLNDNANDIRIAENTALGFKVSFSFSEFNTMDVKTEKGIFTRLIVPSFSRSGEFGSPEFPLKSELIEIPVGAEVNITVLSYDMNEYQLRDLGINYLLMPHQPPAPKTGDIEFVYTEDSYLVNAFNPVELTAVEHLGTMRGVNIGRLDIRPVQYNPVTGVIRVYENLELQVTFENADLSATELNKQLYTNHYFAPVFRTLFNYRSPENAGRENFTRYPIKYVIVSDPMFEEALQPFIEWKRKKGFNMIEAYTNDPNVGTTTFQIKNYLQGLYNDGTPEDPAPSFILFVGDIAQVPTYTGQAASHVTDLYYCEYSGDYFPEVFYGRFSAQNVNQLQPQIDKTLMYEMYTMPVPSYLDTVVMIAGMDGNFGPVHANGQILYGTENYFNESNGIYSHTYLYPQSGSQAAQIRQNVSDGATYVNYTAHGSPSGWADPSFTTSHISQLQNEGKYGLLVGNCCSSSEYQVGECFAEAVVRAANKGALGYIGASNSTYWDEDYYWGVGVGPISGDPPSYDQTTLGSYDRMFHTHGELFGDWYTTMDQMIYAGNLAVTEGSAGMAEYYWEAYNLMGDPSLMIYFSEPPALAVNYTPLLPLGSATFTVNTVPYAYVALSMDGEQLGVALADSLGEAVVTITAVPNPGNADVVVTAQNYQPFTGTVLIANPEGPYVMLNNFLIDDVYGNNDGMIDFGEDIMFDMELKNWGSGDAVNITTVLSADDPYVTFSDDIEDFGTIPAQDSLMAQDAFRFLVADSIPDMHMVNFSLSIQGDTTMWSSSFAVPLFAPAIHIGSMIVSDLIGGNGNLRLDPGENVSLRFQCENNGHCPASDVIALLQTASPYITLENTTYEFDTIGAAEMRVAIFSATVAEEVEPGTLIDFNFSLSSAPYYTSQLFLAPVGQIMEDFETGDFSSFQWVLAGDQPWFIDSEEPYEGMYCAKSGNIGDSQSSSLILDMDVAMNDVISFYCKVSSEPGYDFLGFYIDDVLADEWSGEVEWTAVSFEVPAGQHTFKWMYDKDVSVSNGDDAGWVDNIVFPAVAPFVGTGDSPSKLNAEFTIVPNPARGNASLYIKLDEDSKISVDIYDMTGNKVMTVINNGLVLAGSARLELETSGLTPGMYFCILTDSGRQTTKKLIINK